MPHLIFSFNSKTNTVIGPTTHASLYGARVAARAEYSFGSTKKYTYSTLNKIWYRYDHKKPYDRGDGARWKNVDEAAVPAQLKVYLLLGAAN